jgi:MFS family permease
LANELTSQSSDSYGVFRNPNFRFLMAGTVMSSLSQQMLAIAVAWDLYQATKSPVVLGNVGLVQIIPVMVFALWAGHIADRYDRKRTAALGQFAYTLIGLVLAWEGLHHNSESRNVYLIFGCLFIAGLARTFQWPATSALLPQVVPAESLNRAVSWTASARELSTVGGPAIAGFLLAVLDSGAVYITYTVLAAISLFCFLALTPQPVADRKESAAGWAGLMEGFRFVFSEKLVLYTMLLDLFAVLFGGAVALLPIYANEILNIGPTGLGWLRAAPAFGAALMGFYLAHRPPIHRAGPILLLSVAGFGLATIAFAVSTSAALSFFLLFLTGMFDNISVVLRIFLVNAITPNRMLGRVSAVNSIFINSSNQWGAVESGYAAQYMGTVPSVVFGGTMTMIVVAAIAWLSPQLLKWRIQRDAD